MLWVERKEKGDTKDNWDVWKVLSPPPPHKLLFSVLTLGLYVQHKFYPALLLLNLIESETSKVNGLYKKILKNLFIVLIPLPHNKCGTQEIC